MRNTLGAVLLACTLTAAAGCGSSDSNTSATDQDPAPKQPSTKATPSATPLPKVSLRTSCQLLFPGSQTSALATMQKMWTGGTVTQTTVDHVKGAMREVTRIEQSAPPRLGDQLRVVVEETDQAIKNAYASKSTQTTAYKAAGLEIGNICTAYLY